MFAAPIASPSILDRKSLYVMASAEDATWQDVTQVMRNAPMVHKAFLQAMKRKRQYVEAVDEFNALLSDELERSAVQRKSANDFMKFIDYREFLPAETQVSSASSASQQDPTTNADPSPQKWRRVEVGPTGRLYREPTTETESSDGTE